uniref:Tripartite tricarboxylate transporter family receptor protein n=1 Tax=uncultured bacterium CSL12 TaxID=1091567 RepID=G4WVH4_9BACT|nr:tripartite tricarboxylate transporter family receptor protein [uncultured bacterium CSL12]
MAMRHEKSRRNGVCVITAESDYAVPRWQLRNLLCGLKPVFFRPPCPLRHGERAKSDYHHGPSTRFGYFSNQRGNIVHVPYKGAAQALPDVIGGQIEAYVGNLVGSALATIKSGRVRALGVTSAKRNKQAPDVPTFDEAVDSV